MAKKQVKKSTEPDKEPLIRRQKIPFYVLQGGQRLESLVNPSVKDLGTFAMLIHGMGGNYWTGSGWSGDPAESLLFACQRKCEEEAKRQHDAGVNAITSSLSLTLADLTPEQANLALIYLANHGQLMVAAGHFWVRDSTEEEHLEALRYVFDKAGGADRGRAADP
jgi:hypothetical protein